MTDIVQSAKSVVATVTGFLAHHVSDLGAIHSALTELVSIAPIDSQDKDRINSVLATIDNSAKNITEFLTNHSVENSGDVVVKESDLVTAVANYFNSDAGKEALANATKGNVNG